MFDFLISEVWWMEAIIAAAIAGLCGLFGSFIIYSYKTQKIIGTTEQMLRMQDKQEANQKHDRENIGEEHRNLGKEHANLSIEHMEIKHLQSTLADGVKDTKAFVLRVADEQARQSERYTLLSSEQRSMTDIMRGGIDAARYLERELLRANEQNLSLQKSVNTLTCDLQREKESKAMDLQTVRELQTENRALKARIDELENIPQPEPSPPRRPNHPPIPLDR